MTLTDYLELANELRTSGQRQFGAWSDAAFDAYVVGPAKILQSSLAWREESNPDRTSVANFLQLVYQGVGAGWLRPIEPEVPPPTFLAHCLAVLVPHRLR